MKSFTSFRPNCSKFSNKSINMSHSSLLNGLMNKYSLFRIIFGIICISGCLFQIANISKIYFSYDTTTVVEYEFEKMVSLPAITICFKKEYILRKQNIIRKFPNVTNNNSSDDDLMLYLNKMNLKEQLLATLSYEEIFDNKCYAMKTIAFNQSDDYLNCDQIKAIQTTIGYYWKCFRFFSQSSNESNDKYLINHDVSTRENWKPIIYFHMRIDSQAMALFMHPRNEILRDFFGDNKLTIYFENYGLTLIKYYKTIIKLMPKPYRTDCVDYKLMGYQSKIGCVKECLKKYYIEKYGGLPAAFQFGGEYDGHFIENWRTIENNLSHNLLVSKKCTQVCGSNDDCYKEYINIRFISIDNFFPRMNGSHRILILPPTSPNLIYTHTNKIHLEEFLCYAGSVISLWFGVSILMISDIISRLHKYLTQYRKKKNIIANFFTFKIKVPNDRFHGYSSGPYKTSRLSHFTY